MNDVEMIVGLISASESEDALKRIGDAIRTEVERGYEWTKEAVAMATVRTAWSDRVKELRRNGLTGKQA